MFFTLGKISHNGDRPIGNFLDDDIKKKTLS